MTKPRTWTEKRGFVLLGGVALKPVMPDDEPLVKLSDAVEVIQVRVTEILPDEVERAERVIKYSAGFEPGQAAGPGEHNIWLHGYYSEQELEAMLTLLRAENADL